jgi:zinc and cadmium transporter
VTLLFIVASGILMSCIALVGAVAVFIREETLKKALLPMVALSAGSLLGAALFHMIPKTVEQFENSMLGYIWVAVGFAVFFCLEQFLHWHHCHRPTSEHHHAPTYLLLIADGLHNLVGGLTVGAAFMFDFRLGVTTFLAEAAHELPQEIGDFGVLVHGGWSVKKALIYNFLSSSTFMVGALGAYLASAAIDIAYVVPFAAGNFLYIAAVDLVPEVNKHAKLTTSILHFGCFLAGLTMLLVVAGFAHG